MATTMMNHPRDGKSSIQNIPIALLEAFWSCCRRGLSTLSCRPSQRQTIQSDVLLAFLIGAVFALLGATLANLFLFSSASFSWTTVRGSIYYNDAVPKQAAVKAAAAASVDFAGEIVTQLNDTACVEQQLHPPTETDTAVICAIAKYEEMYLDEFVDYHLALGFSHIFIYDNTADFELKQWAKTKSCRVSVKHFPGSNPQAKAYLNCARTLPYGRPDNQQKNPTWIAFFDLDEFLILIDQEYQNTSNAPGSGGGMVVPFLRDHCPPGVALGLNWRVMGTAGHTLYQPAPVTLRFQYATGPVPDQHVKSIIRLNDLNLDRLSHVHYPRFKKQNKDEKDNTTATLQQQRDTSGKVFTGPFNPNGPSDVALFYHYV
jgi:Glycosyl transferase family 2